MNAKIKFYSVIRLKFLEFFFIMPIFTKNDQQLCIPIASSSVQFLQSPEQFYQELMKRISTSGKRIILSALYLGTGEKEQAIIEELQNTMERNNRIKIAILLDYFRGTRNDHSKNSTNSSVAILRPLITNNFMVYLFHTPEMRGFLKNLLPERINEIVGLQHMKFFIFDDSIIVSGANLSEQYFENRQDRYLLIENSPMLADFFHSVFNIISRHSLKLESNGDLKFDGNHLIHPFTGSNEEIAKSVREEIGKLYEEYKGLASTNQMRENSENCETFLVPFLQMGAFKIDEEIQMLNRLFNNEREPLDVTLVTAYFNLYDEYADLILRKCNFPVKIIFGSPNTNGFYGAAGKSGQIPALYEQNILDFMKRVVDSGREKIEFLEWNRKNWTFHAKGIWANSGDGKKMATIIGSSNYGYRSAHRDLEAQILLITENEALKNKIMEEKNSLLEYAETQDVNAFLRRNHLIPTWVKYFSRIFRNFF